MTAWWCVSRNHKTMTTSTHDDSMPICACRNQSRMIGSACRTKTAQFYGSPNEDFGRPNQPSGTRFRSTFQGREYSIWVNRKRVRLGTINCAIFLFTTWLGLARTPLQHDCCYVSKDAHSSCYHHLVMSTDTSWDYDERTSCKTTDGRLSVGNNHDTIQLCGSYTM